MSRKTFRLASIILVFAFAVFFIGGCGGGSSNSINPDNSESHETSVELPDIIDIVSSDEFITLMNNFLDELISNDITILPAIQYVMISGDRVYMGSELSYFARRNLEGREFRGASLPADQMDRLTQILKPRYELGDVIALLYPTPNTINDLYEALGEQRSYTSDKGDDEVTSELFAMAKRAGKSIHFFSYELPTKEDLAKIDSDDISSNGGDEEDIENNSPDEDDNGGYQIPVDNQNFRAAFLFQAERAVNFLRWAAFLDIKAQEAEIQTQALNSQFRASAAETSSGSFIEFNSQHIDKDTSQYEADYVPEWKKETSEAYKTDVNFKSGFSLEVFSAHSFSEGDDYYLVKSNAFTKPNNFQDRKVDGWRYISGHTAKFEFRAEPENVNSNVFLRNNAPKSINRSGSVTDGIDTTIGGSFGVSGKIASSPSLTPSASISKSMSYSHSKTWETSEWRLDNKSGNVTAQWIADFYNGSDKYWPNKSNGDVAGASKVRLDIDSEWIWRVYKSYWQQYPKLWVEVTTYTTPCYTRWKKDHRKYTMGTYYATRWVSFNRPPHVVVDPIAFNFGPEADQTAMFKLLCNDNYTITSDSDWCNVAANQATGGDTGANEREIFFAVDAYTSNEGDAFNTRTATITVKENNTGDYQEITVTQRNK